MGERARFMVWGLLVRQFFFVGKAATLWMGALGILKALVWPVYLVYYALQFLAK